MQPDIFTNVHKGLRRALFETCVALGRAGDDPERDASARAQLREVLRFVAHHGANEDELLIPMLEADALAVSERLRLEHDRLDAELTALVEASTSADIETLYQRTCGFTITYLEHMREEEQVLEAQIRATLTVEQLAWFGREAVERTAPDDRQMMMGWMLPALPTAITAAAVRK